MAIWPNWAWAAASTEEVIEGGLRETKEARVAWRERVEQLCVFPWCFSVWLMGYEFQTELTFKSHHGP